MSSIDRADWHYGNNFPENIPEENGGTHIGMYLAWIIENDLVGEIHLLDTMDGLAKVKSREITGRDFLFKYCDEKFWEQDLNPIGLKFTSHYYSSNQYFSDYADTLADHLNSVYEVENSWQNYDVFKPIINHRFRQWSSRRGKKFWQFWK